TRTGGRGGGSRAGPRCGGRRERGRRCWLLGPRWRCRRRHAGEVGRHQERQVAGFHDRRGVLGCGHTARPATHQAQRKDRQTGHERTSALGPLGLRTTAQRSGSRRWHQTNRADVIRKTPERVSPRAQVVAFGVSWVRTWLAGTLRPNAPWGG